MKVSTQKLLDLTIFVVFEASWRVAEDLGAVTVLDSVESGAVVDCGFGGLVIVLGDLLGLCYCRKDQVLYFLLTAIVF